MTRPDVTRPDVPGSPPPPAGADVPDVVLVVDAANVVGSRPDGWWRDRVGAATRLLGRLAPVVGATVPGATGAPVRIAAVEVVLEGQARAAVDPHVPGLVVRLAPRDGDTEVVVRARAAAPHVLVVTADRGLRERLGAAPVVGPGWWHRLDAAQDDMAKDGESEGGQAQDGGAQDGEAEGDEAQDGSR